MRINIIGIWTSVADTDQSFLINGDQAPAEILAVDPDPNPDYGKAYEDATNRLIRVADPDLRDLDPAGILDLDPASPAADIYVQKRE